MNRILIAMSCLVLAGCTCTLPQQVRDTAPPDCQRDLSHFYTYVEDTLLASERSVWLVDFEVFYTPQLETCIGKYIAYRKEGKKDDMVVFVIRNIRENEDIYYEKLTDRALLSEYEGHKKYQEKVSELRGS